MTQVNSNLANIDSSLSAVSSITVTGTYVDVTFYKWLSLVHVTINAHPKLTLSANQEKLNCAIPTSYRPKVNINNSDVWADKNVLYTALRDGSVYVSSSYDVYSSLWYSANFTYLAQ